jgi:hypothetical protein
MGLRSGSRSGIAPSRLGRGAGDGSLTVGLALTCGHSTDEEPIAKGSTFAIYMCPRGCGLVKRAPRARTTDRKEERHDSHGDQRRSPTAGNAR